MSEHTGLGWDGKRTKEDMTARWFGTMLNTFYHDRSASEKYRGFNIQYYSGSTTGSNHTSSWSVESMWEIGRPPLEKADFKMPSCSCRSIKQTRQQAKAFIRDYLKKRKRRHELYRVKVRNGTKSKEVLGKSKDREKGNDEVRASL